jgi:hypothetical protein
MAEVLAPTRQDITQEFERGFDGMTEKPVRLDDLLQTREELITELIGKMPNEHRRFLGTFKKGKPEWELLGIPHVEKLPPFNGRYRISQRWTRRGASSLSAIAQCPRD